MVFRISRWLTSLGPNIGAGEGRHPGRTSMTPQSFPPQANRRPSEAGVHPDGGDPRIPERRSNSRAWGAFKGGSAQSCLAWRMPPARFFL
jgi:hypothetical protein